MGKEGAVKKETPAGAPAEQQQHHPKKSEAPAAKGKGPAQMPGGCVSWGCKSEGKQFGFCAEHYDHFKFGLIKKTGEPVSDYEKKYEHYMAYKAKRGAQRVA